MGNEGNSFREETSWKSLIFNPNFLFTSRNNFFLCDRNNVRADIRHSAAKLVALISVCCNLGVILACISDEDECC
jgi:hypothetical protein